MNKDILKELGLTENETKILILLIKEGNLGATKIAKKTGLNRPYTYYALERLTEKGYLAEHKEQGKKQFKTIPLNEIVHLEEQKIDSLKEFIKECETLQKSKEETEISLLKGKYAARNIMKKILSEIKPNQEILYIGLDEEKMEEQEPIYIYKILNHFKKNNIKEKIIIKENSLKLPYAKTATYKTLPNNLIGNTAKIIYQDIVIDIIYDEPFHATITKNKELADTARKQFELFWKTAKTI